MAFKLFHVFCLIFLVFLLFSTTSHAKRTTPSAKNSNPFDFIKKLKGCHKGNHTKGIHQLKAYLKKFGYLEYLNQTHANDDDFDSTLESAIITYQKNYHIKPTGTLDDTTISKMITPRCGVPDIVNGTNYMQPRNKTHVSGSSHIHTVSHFSFFDGNPRWPKTHLTYRLLPNLPSAAINPVARAFQKWASATHFTFSRVQSNQNSDLVIGFYRGNHGDGDINSFDGRGGTIAHAFEPTIGIFHYDADEQWSVGAVPNALDYETVALHEIGHLLGLGHSIVKEAIMYSRIGAGEIKNLHGDDIEGIRVLYNP